MPMAVPFAGMGVIVVVVVVMVVGMPAAAAGAVLMVVPVGMIVGMGMLVPMTVLVPVGMIVRMGMIVPMSVLVPMVVIMGMRRPMIVVLMRMAVRIRVGVGVGVIMPAAAARAVLVMVPMPMPMIVIVIVVIVTVGVVAMVVMPMVVMVVVAAVRAVDMLGLARGTGGLALAAAFQRGGHLGIVHRRNRRSRGGRGGGGGGRSRDRARRMVVRQGMAVAIGTALRREGLGDEADRPGAELLQHLDQHIVVADADRAGPDLGRGMPVAEMPGDPGEQVGVVCGHLGQPFRLGDDRHHPAILEQEAVALDQRRRLGEIDMEQRAGPAGHGQPAPAAVLVVELDAVGDGRRRIGPGGNGGIGADHGRVPDAGSRRAADGSKRDIPPDRPRGQARSGVVQAGPGNDIGMPCFRRGC